MAGHTRPRPTNISSLTCFLSLVTISMKTLVVSFQRYYQSILESSWIRAFQPTTCELEFSQIWSSCRKTENRSLSFQVTSSEKIMIKFCKKSENSHFGSIADFRGTFLANLLLSLSTLSILLLLCILSEKKNNEKTPTKVDYRCTD